MVDTSSQSQNQQPDDINRFRVVIRVRPFLDEELTSGGKKGKHQCVQFYKDNQTVSLIRPNYDQRDFLFDCVLDQQTEQETAYEQIAFPVVQDVLQGFNGVIMAYGQTGSGKTHTIFGSRPSLDFLTNNKGEESLHYQCGIVPRCVNHVFDYIKENPNKAQFRVTVSFLEIYMEQITDLLLPQTSSQPSQSPRAGRPSSMSPIRGGGSATSLSSNQGGSNLQIREDPKTGIFVHGLTQIHVKSKDQLNQLIKQGAKRRSVNQTAMNKNSSRSHAVLQIFVEQRWVEKTDEQINSPNTPSSNRQNSSGKVKKRHFRKSLLTIVDLAGSERLSKTGSEGMQLQEAKNINKSIAALSNCISALASQKSLQHIPFRDSKLTRLLTESLGGNCKTTICACISPSLLHYEESYSTLLFATRAMSVKTFVTMNEKVEYKVLDEQGKSIQPSSSKVSNLQNEQVLLKKNNELVGQTEELKQEIQQLKDQIKKQQSLVSSFQTMPYHPIQNYNSNFTNQSQENNQAQGLSWGIQSMYQKPQVNNMQMNPNLNTQNFNMSRSHSPPPSHSYNPLTAANLAQVPNVKSPFIFGNFISPQKGSPLQQINGNQIIPHVDSENFQFDGQGGGPSITQSNANINQALKFQQIKDSQLVNKLTSIIDTLQEQLLTQTQQIQQLAEENQKFKQISQGGGINTNVIDGILNNPQLRQVLFEKLAKSNFS